VGSEVVLEETDKRILKERRKQPTPALSRYTFLGERKRFRRKIDQQTGGYVDRYSSRLFFFLILIISLNILDALFTIIIIELNGVEINPIVLSVMHLYGDRFWIWKFAIVSFCSVLLCLHIRFGRVKVAVVSISFIYLAVVLYQFYLITYH
jgi:hypothetical protein